MRKIYFVFTFCLILLFVSFYGTHSYFSDSKVSGVNTFTAASVFPTSPVNTTPPILPTGIQVVAGAILINEINPHVNATDEWVELYNTTSSSINVSGWKINDEDFSDIIPNVPPIPAGGYAVIIAEDSNVTPPLSSIKIQLTSAIGNSLNANNEALSLRLPDNTIIDALNWGTVTTFFSPSVTGPANGKTMSRLPNGIDTNTAIDWISTSSATLGISNNP